MFDTMKYMAYAGLGYLTLKLVEYFTGSTLLGILGGICAVVLVVILPEIGTKKKNKNKEKNGK